MQNALLLAALSAVSWAAWSVFGKLAVERVDATKASFVMVAVELVVAAVAMHKSGWSLGGMSWAGIVFAVLAGVGGFGGLWFYAKALEVGQMSTVVVVSHLYIAGVVMVGLAWGESMSARELLGSALVIVGTLLLVSAQK